MMESGSVGGNTQTCMFCKFAIGELDKMLEDKHNEEEIKQALDGLCNALPRNYADQCKTFVDTYTDIIIDMITKDATPEEVDTFEEFNFWVYCLQRFHTIKVRIRTYIYQMFK